MPSISTQFGTAGTLIISGTAERVAEFNEDGELSSSEVTTDELATLSGIDTSRTIEERISTVSNLPNGQILIGNDDGNATAVTPSGDWTITNTGVASITAGVIVDADVNSAAAITRSKLATGTADHVVINDGTGVISSEATLAITRGGTGQATATLAFNALSPSTSKGDLITNDGTNDVRQAVGTNDFVLVADSAQTNGIKWASPPPNTTKGDIASHNGTVATRLAVGSNDQVLVASSGQTTGLQWVDPPVAVAGTRNIGLSLSSNVLKVIGANGSVFSSTNPGWVNLPSTTAGRRVTLSVTSDTHTLNDAGHGTPQFIDEPFGKTAGIAWGSAMPLYLYACLQDGDAGIKFALSPRPNATVVPPTANIGYQLTPAATPSDNNFFFLTSTDPTTAFDGNPCIRIGGVRATMSSGNDWTFTALSNSVGDGISPNPYEGEMFTMPVSQMGAETGEYLAASGGTQPTWATPANIAYEYSMRLDGRFEVHFSTQDAGACTNGTGTGSLNVATPYKVFTTSGSERKVIGAYQATSAGTTSGGLIGSISEGASQITLFDTSNTAILGNDFSAAGDDIFLHTMYRAFE